MVEVVYRATKAATSIYSTALKQAVEDRKAALAAFLDKQGCHPDTEVYAHDEGTGRVIGVRNSHPDATPYGWRVDRRHPDAIVPNLRTKHGKKIDEQLAGIPHANGRRLLPGEMPDHCLAGHVLMHPSVEVLGGHLYVGWPKELPDKIATQLGLGVVWEEVPLSTYYLAREAAEVEEVGRG
ncbi:hypothetical protein [Nocardiopsis sp. YSL2]|uniref:hypothetical protein n=1 Tax=Nocardiopsis sp. YSL2 TaxID=2939492 RepID=UPI0026F45BC0|nr:hypothetical protein [Nocardiopsis sp. YSL2]